jgi:hypothetical protein
MNEIVIYFVGSDDPYTLEDSDEGCDYIYNYLREEGFEGSLAFKLRNGDREIINWNKVIRIEINKLQDE